MSTTAMDRTEIQDVLAAYTNALESTNADALRESWKLPAFLISDLGARAILNDHEFEDIYGWSMDWYHMQGIAKAVPVVESFQALSEAIAEVTVRWIGSNPVGKNIWEERAKYFLGRELHGPMKIRAAIYLGGQRMS